MILQSNPTETNRPVPCLPFPSINPSLPRSPHTLNHPSHYHSPNSAYAAPQSPSPVYSADSPNHLAAFPARSYKSPHRQTFCGKLWQRTSTSCRYSCARPCRSTRCCGCGCCGCGRATRCRSGDCRVGTPGCGFERWGRGWGGRRR